MSGETVSPVFTVFFAIFNFEFEIVKQFHRLVIGEEFLTLVPTCENVRFLMRRPRVTAVPPPDGRVLGHPHGRRVHRRGHPRVAASGPEAR